MIFLHRFLKASSSSPTSNAKVNPPSEKVMVTKYEYVSACVTMERTNILIP